MISKGFIALVRRMREAQKAYYATPRDADNKHNRLCQSRALEDKVDKVLATSENAPLFPETDEPPKADPQDSMTKMQALIKEHGYEKGKRLWREWVDEKLNK